ncbi:MAG: GNAT family N-acetyltransferase [Oscillospiraceae bacterium]|jgi:ribosomal protein S18 acetylase RimI-like enzyme|nr:GNAT family N-acetyltransferase [Oscillospiraceae bacterium]
MDEIRVVEELLLNSIPALTTVLLDGWVIRLNQKYTYRSNCVCPLSGMRQNTAETVERCEKLFEHNRLPSVFKVTPVLQEGLPQLLRSMQYRNIKKVNVMRGVLKQETHRFPSEIQCSETPDPDWLDASARLTGVSSPELVSIHCRGLAALAVRSVFVKAVRDGKIVGCGYGTVERGYAGLYDLHVAPEYRRAGIGTSICNAVFEYGRKHGAEMAYLVVHSRNQNAIQLYSHLGFSPFYEYEFFQKENSKYRIVDA